MQRVIYYYLLFIVFIDTYVHTYLVIIIQIPQYDSKKLTVTIQAGDFPENTCCTIIMSQQFRPHE